MNNINRALQMHSKAFINSTGQSIPQLYHQLYYKVPGLSFPSQSDDSKQNSSLLHYAIKLIRLIPHQLKYLFQCFSFKAARSLQSQFQNQSLAILANSVDLNQAILKSVQYNIPLMQIVINTPEGQKLVRQKLLLNFAVAHLINQNFVLFGDWQKHEELQSAVEQIADEEEIYDTQQGIYFRKQELIYAFLSLRDISKYNENILQENLLKIRNIFYSTEKHQKQSFRAKKNFNVSHQQPKQQPNFPHQQSEQILMNNFIDSQGEEQAENMSRIDPQQ